MKKLISLALAALLLLNLAACGESSVSNPSGSSGDSSSSADPAQPDAFSPVTTEAEVRALYGDDASLITSIEAYQGDFLVKLGTDEDCPSLDWVYGQSGIRRRMLWLDTPLLRCEIESQATIRVVTGGANIYNGVPGFPRVELATLRLLYDEQGRDRGYDPYVSPGIGSSEIYWAGAGERYSMGMQGRREAIRSAQVDAGGLTVAFAPLADGSDFVAAYCEIPYTEVALSEDGMTLTVTMHDTFLSSGTLSKDVDPDFLKEYGSLYPESFPAGELAGSCTLIENADLRQDGNNAVLTVTLADSPIHGRNFDDGYYRFTAETGYTGIADTGPYLRVTLNATNELFAGNFKFTESDRIRENREAVKRDNNNIFDFMESEGYIRRKADASISSKDFYEIYRMWCEENSLAPLKARSFSDAMIANAGRFNLEHCNNITNSAGRRVWGFMGVEAVARPHINGFYDVSPCTYVPEGWRE